MWVEGRGRRGPGGARLGDGAHVVAFLTCAGTLSMRGWTRKDAMKHAAVEAIGSCIPADGMHEPQIGSGAFDKVPAEATREIGMARREKARR